MSDLVGDPVDSWLNAPIPKTLWHYTSIRGFHGIVTSKKIFATDVRYLNDREEFIYARKITEQKLAGANASDDSYAILRFLRRNS
jgi:hypothetical protein